MESGDNSSEIAHYESVRLMLCSDPKVAYQYFITAEGYYAANSCTALKRTSLAIQRAAVLCINILSSAH